MSCYYTGKPNFTTVRHASVMQDVNEQKKILQKITVRVRTGTKVRRLPKMQAPLDKFLEARNADPTHTVSRERLDSRVAFMADAVTLRSCRSPEALSD